MPFAISKTRLFAALALLLLLAGSPLSAKKSKEQKQQPDPLEQYMKQLSASASGAAAPARGSLFTTSGLLADPYADVKARQVGDTIAIHVVESTTISQSGTLATQRNFSHSSAVTGIMGQSPSVLNPLLAANSGTKLSGTGATASKSSLNTVLTGVVMAALPNGLLVVEARRELSANQQHENVVLRGVVRPADISATNSVFSYQLYDLQLEVKGKGVISDSVRQPNIVVRTLLKLLSF